jgi:hypothetical protein
MEDKRNAYQRLVSKTEGKRSLEAKSTDIGIQRNGVWIGLKWLTYTKTGSFQVQQRNGNLRT